MLSSNFFWNTHWPWDIDCKNNTYILLPLHFLINYLGSSLQDVVDLIWFRDFLRLNLNIVLGVTKFTIPYLAGITLIFFGLFNSTMHIEGSIARFAKDWISCSHLCPFFKGSKFNDENVSIDFLIILFTSCSWWISLGHIHSILSPPLHLRRKHIGRNLIWFLIAQI